MASVQEKARCVLWFHESRSVITVQRRFRLEYGRNPPSNNSIKRWYRQFEQTGSVQHRKGAGRPPVSEAIVDQVRELFTRSPGKSTRRASLELGLPRSTTLHYLFHRAPLGGRTNSVNVIVEPLPIGLGLNNCIRVDPWSRLSIPEGRKLFLVGDLRLSHPINKQTVTIWVSVNLSSPLSLRKNLVVLALYQYSRPSPLSEADNIANPRGGVAIVTENTSSILRPIQGL
ncbi:hypothetical protein J6590_061240 [Homalodisca vitripennis]|nr:hypothetical protein J6590_061240 [Homalodisca vitripennis]